MHVETVGFRNISVLVDDGAHQQLVLLAVLCAMTTPVSINPICLQGNHALLLAAAEGHHKVVSRLSFNIGDRQHKNNQVCHLRICNHSRLFGHIKLLA